MEAKYDDRIGASAAWGGGVCFSPFGGKFSECRLNKAELRGVLVSPG